MIRRDYILRMIEECIRALARIAALKQAQRSGEAAKVLDAELQKLVGVEVEGVAGLSESDLLARLMQDGPTQALRDKTLILTTLLKEAGDLATAENRLETGGLCHLKALNLLLEVLAREEALPFPEFVPKVDMLLAALHTTALPPRTCAMLMLHYERTGQFAMAEDALFSLLEVESNNPAAVELGVAFYNRLRLQPEEALLAGNLPRAEVEQGLQELLARPLPSD